MHCPRAPAIAGQSGVGKRRICEGKMNIQTISSVGLLAKLNFNSCLLPDLAVVKDGAIRTIIEQKPRMRHYQDEAVMSGDGCIGYSRII